MRKAALVLLLALATALHAAPFTPANDNEVVEKLPATTDPAVRNVLSLRRQLEARPDDGALRLEIARRYFDLAMAQGDPRYVGYAQAALVPVAQSSAGDARYWLLQGMVQQYGHDFDGALQSLAKSASLDPRSAEPLAWRAAIFMVQARYAEAKAECDKLVPLADPLYTQGCRAYVQATTGGLRAAYEALDAAMRARPDVAPELELWLRTRLAEMAVRLQQPDAAEAHFRAALRTGVTDQFLLGAYADFLIARGRAGHAITLLNNWERSDILLLRMATAGRMAGDPRARDWAKQLRERFDDAARRGDRLHEQEAARFTLEIEGRPDAALALAKRNYEKQKEPRDAEILLRAAVAARQSQAAQAAIEWLRASRYEDPALAKLAEALK
ncbi:tetratricopeptide repeat protein [Ramlibacter sp.]|uniref:tetratricopeptide repeat protein n=1 Tax=Ramlibacter sp. TaxID=1917967 RepID=UPI003D0D919E